MTILRIVFFAQLLVMLSGFAMFLVTPIDFHTVGLIFYLGIVALALLPFALWQFARHPDRRRWATATAATPFICVGTPLLFVSLSGGPAHPLVLVLMLVVLLIISILVLLSRTKQLGSGGFLSSKRFNLSFLITLGVLFVLFWLPFIGWMYNQESLSWPRGDAEGERLFRIIAIYFVSVAGPALLLSLFTLLYVPVGLVRNRENWLVHLSQLTIALLSLASLTAGAFVVSIFLVNPG